MACTRRSATFWCSHFLTALTILFSSQDVRGWTTLPIKTVPPPLPRARSSRQGPTGSPFGTQLAMGLRESIAGFLQNTQKDFVKLDDGEAAFGPGPSILLYQVTLGVTDEEIQDMVEDAAPIAHRKGCRLCRVTDDLMDMSLEEALNKVTSGKVQLSANEMTTTAPIPVLLFSGFQNDEMLNVHTVLSNEIYEETAGQSLAACAKAVPNAMQKSCRQVLEEISGDHQMSMQKEGN